MNEIITHADGISPDIVVARLSDEQAADIAEQLNKLDPSAAAAVLYHFPLEQAIEVLDLRYLESAAEIIQTLPIDHAVRLLAGMSADQTVGVLREIEEPTRSQMLQKIEPQTRASLRELLAYPEHSAGSIMTTEFVSVPANWTIRQTLDYIRRVERTRETV